MAAAMLVRKKRDPSTGKWAEKEEIIWFRKIDDNWRISEIPFD
jgi:hypothetical protein